MNYYYQNENMERVGPIDEATFFGAAAAGAILPNALVWREGEPEWRRWADVAGIWIPLGMGAFPQPAAPAAATPECDRAVSPDVGMDGVFSDGWNVFKKNWGRIVGGACLISTPVVFFWVLVTALLVVVGNATISESVEIMANSEGPAEYTYEVTAFSEEERDDLEAGPAAISPALSVVAGPILVAVCLLITFLGTVYCYGLLKILRKEDAGEKVSFGTLFPFGRAFKKIPACAVVYFLEQGIPFLVVGVLAKVFEPIFAGADLVILLFYLVMLFLWVRLGFAFLVVFDTNNGPLSALKVSWQITSGQFWRSVAYGFVCTLIMVVCLAFSLGFAAIVVYPLGFLWYSTYYIKLMKTAKVAVPESVL